MKGSLLMLLLLGFMIRAQAASPSATPSFTPYAGSPTFTLTPTVSPTLTATVTPPPEFSFRAAYPNPASNGMSFVLHMPAQGRVEACIYSLSGEKVRSFQMEFPEGFSAMKWNLTNQAGERVAPGVYLVRLRYSTFNRTDVDKRWVTVL
jgi:hypothetical protein